MKNRFLKILETQIFIFRTKNRLLDLKTRQKVTHFGAFSGRVGGGTCPHLRACTKNDLSPSSDRVERRVDTWLHRLHAVIRRGGVSRCPSDRKMSPSVYLYFFGRQCLRTDLTTVQVHIYSFLRKLQKSEGP